MQPGSIAPDVVLAFGPFELVPLAPFVHDFDTLLKIDVQPRSAPVETGFTGLFGNAYSKLNGCVFFSFCLVDHISL